MIFLGKIVKTTMGVSILVPERTYDTADKLLFLSFPDGTHVAAIIGGNKFGIAKNTFIHCIKVFQANGETTVDDVIQGVDIAIDAILRSGKPSVITMSLAGPVSLALDGAVCTLPVNCDHAAYTNMRPTGAKGR
jgi:subtilisin family serine protease